MSDYDNGYDEGYRAGMQKMREVGQARIEELEAKLAEVEAERDRQYDENVHRIVKEAEAYAKLAKAVEALEHAKLNMPHPDQMIDDALAELKGDT